MTPIGIKLQPQLENLLSNYGYIYSHTLDSYTHYYYNNNNSVMYNPDELSFHITKDGVIVDILEDYNISIENVLDLLKLYDEK